MSAHWEETLTRALKHNIDTKRSLRGYWDNACEQAEEEGIPLDKNRPKWARENAVNSLIDNLYDMPKEDAITTLVDLYAEQVL